MVYWIAHALFVVISKIFFPVRVCGLHDIPSRGGFILASNHSSNLDPMILGIASGRRLNYVAKESLFKNKIFSCILYLVGAFPIRRDTGDVGAIKEALKRLNKGGGLVIFPEGTRKTKEGEKKTQPGIGLLAVKGHAVVIPAFIRGSEKVLAPGAKFIKPGRISVLFGEPVSYSTEDSYPEIAERIMQAIDSLSSVSADLLK